MVVFALSDGRDRGEPATWVSAIEIAIGMVAVAFAVRAWRLAGGNGSRPPRGRGRSMPSDPPQHRAALGLSCGNPKNLLLTLGAATAVAEAEASAGEATGGLVAFVALGSLGVIVPVASFLVLGERSRRGLGALRRWLTRYEAVVLALILLAIGAKLLTAGLSSLWAVRVVGRRPAHAPVMISAPGGSGGAGRS